jgi:hypothetical protein
LYSVIESPSRIFFMSTNINVGTLCKELELKWLGCAKIGIRGSK